jgi:hypothetical protein
MSSRAEGSGPPMAARAVLVVALLLFAVVVQLPQLFLRNVHCERGPQSSNPKGGLIT